MTRVAPRPLLASLFAAAAILAGCLVAAGDARAARGMELAIQDDQLFVQGNPRFDGDRPFEYARALGVTRIRVNLLWAYTMPSRQYTARNKPSTVTYDVSEYDRLIDRAAQHGIRVHMSLTGPAPRWANARRALANRAWNRPSVGEFGRWATIMAQHFAGRVDRWSVWNEPNWKTWLGPLKAAPAIYRSMYVRAYDAIKQADPRAKVLIGETSPYARPGLSTAPLAFLRAVTCVNKDYRRTRSRCPRLRADGYAHHPYDFRNPPGFAYPGADNVTIGTLSRLTRALDRLRRSGALRFNGAGRMPVYLTEYGYFASGKRALSSRLRSRYLQQAYSRALANRRVKSQLQYLLMVLPRGSASTFNTGLVSRSGARLAQYRALQRWYRGHRGRVKRPGAAITLPPALPNPTG